MNGECLSVAPRPKARNRSFWTLLALSFALGGCRTISPGRVSRTPPPPPPPLAKAVVRTAKSYLPEENNGQPVPRDCSDFVRRVFAQHNIRLPRTSREMARRGDPIRSSRELRMGDLVFFAGSRVGRSIGHVGIYVNKGIFIHLTHPEDGVTLDSMYNDYYRRRYLLARRVIP